MRQTNPVRFPSASLRWAILVLMLMSCVSQGSPIVVASSAKPYGWTKQDSLLLIGDGLQSFFVRTDPLSLQRIEAPWRFSEPVIHCVSMAFDGSAIIYRTSDNSDKRQLFLQENGNNPTLAVLTTDLLSCPTWSPDGQSFAVTVGQQLRIYDRKTLSYRDRNAVPALPDLSWSPDGKVIAVITSDDIRYVDAVTGEVVKQFRVSQGIEQLTWSPNGQYIAYIEPLLSRHEGALVIAKSDGTERRSLAGPISMTDIDESDYLYTMPLWSPQGNYIAARRIPATAHDIHLDRNYEVILLEVPEELQRAATQ